MPKCTVCHHPEHLAIDQAILSGEFTMSALSQKFGPSPSALHRHKGHLQEKMQESRRRLQEIQEQGSLILLNAFLEHVKKGVETAEAEGNLTGVFRGSYIGSRIINQLNRMERSISLDTLHRLLTSPAWVPQRSLLPTDLKLITELHQALVDSVSLSCPEPLTLISDDDTDEDEDWDESVDPFLGTRNSELETQLVTLRQLQELLPDLDLTLDDLPPRTEKPPKKYRKISEKSAKNTPGLIKNSHENHPHTPSEKKLPKNPYAGRDPQGGASPSEEPPAVLENIAPQAVSANDPLSVMGAGGSPPAVPAMPNACPIPSPATENGRLPDPCSFVPDPCLLRTHDPADIFITGHCRPASSPPAAAPVLPVSKEAPDLYNGTGDELFLMTHGYPRDSPPKHIPNRRLDEDLRGFSLFREIKKFF